MSCDSRGENESPTPTGAMAIPEDQLCMFRWVGLAGLAADLTLGDPPHQLCLEAALACQVEDQVLLHLEMLPNRL